MKLNKLFEIEYGQHEYNSKSNLIKGNIPLISSQGVDNGCYGLTETFIYMINILYRRR